MLSASACASPAAPLEARAKELEGAGKIEEAAAALDAVCVVATGKDCEAARAKAASLRIDAAKKAIEEGHYVAAERALIVAEATDANEARREAGSLLASDELTQGLAFERALGFEDKDAARAEVTKVAGSSAKVASKAKAWLDDDAPRAAIDAAKRACIQSGEGSCSKAAAALRSLAKRGSDAESALAQGLIEAEERRVYPLRLEAERFLALFAARKMREKSAEDCAEAQNRMGGGPPTPERLLTCRQNLMAEDTWDRVRNDDVLFRRLMTKIGDSEILGPLWERRRAADDDGTYAKADVPKPPKEKK